MPLLLFILLPLFIHLHTAYSEAPVYTEYMYPTISVSDLLYIKSEGTFLRARNGNFEGMIYRPGTQQTRFYLSVVHVQTGTVIWTANRNDPMPDRESRVTLTPEALTVGYSNGDLLWSTPRFKSNVSALRLLDTGNLVLLDTGNETLWESFDYPTDTIVSGQILRTGSFLSSTVDPDEDLSRGDYRLDVTSSDAVLNWTGSNYWVFSNDTRSAVTNRDAKVAHLSANDSGIHLLGSNGDVVVRIAMPPAEFRILQLGSDGRLVMNSYSSLNSSAALTDAFTAPTGICDLPVLCGPLGLCSPSGTSFGCSCPPRFVSANQSTGCSPENGVSLASNTSCVGNSNIYISYVLIGNAITYFANKYMNPVDSVNSTFLCQDLCSSNCSCHGYFFQISSQSCFLSLQPLGSLVNVNASASGKSYAYVKIQGSNRSVNSSSSRNNLAILTPTVIAFVLVVIIVASLIYWRRKQKGKIKGGASSVTKRKLSDSDYLFSENGDDMSEIIIQGLPEQYTFEQVEEMTGNFRTKIGSGGFGSVYKGELPDKSEVAVKKIEAAGVQGRKEFCTEIAVIGNIHHVNLVRLRGYCAQTSHRLLIYEYMNRGSLDQSLFRLTEKLLTWSERMNIAIGAARGIAYLHAGCQPKILHCDIKPENILLDEEGRVKIADFGLAKLLRPEQSVLFTTMRGTRGYLAPEWIMNAAISDRSDVFSFGMVLLELVRGKKNKNEQSNCSTTSDGSSATNKYEYFPLIALEMHLKGRYEELVDPRLEKNFNVTEVERVIKTALCCLHEEPPLRPNMTSVVAMLEGTVNVWEPRTESLGSLRMHGRCHSGSTSNATGEIDGDDEMKGIKVGSGSNVASDVNSGGPSVMSSHELSGPR